MRRLALLLSLIFIGVGCRGPVPPAADVPAETAMALQLLMWDGSEIPLNTLLKVHGVGKSPCPDEFEPIKIMAPEGVLAQDWYADGWPEWIDGPETGKIGEPFTPKFNCNITDLSKHTEEGTVTFRIEGHMGRDTDEAQAELDRLRDTENLPVEPAVLKIDIDIGK